MDTRWQQCFKNFRSERNGLIQRYGYTIHLAWEMMKDDLEVLHSENL
ncbi:MAG: nucleotidyltransferase substrate binding protein [Tannerella sp.]|nr:nucleotidyltransferase substrate binding protein [Tannerella sp.]